MLWSLPGTDTKIRVFEEVKTEDKQYNVVDCGLEYAEGGIDSIVTGGSFHSLKNLCGQLDKKADEAKAEKADAVKTSDKVAELQTMLATVTAQLAALTAPAPETEEAPASETVAA